jgi:hypothetical protein
MVPWSYKLSVPFEDSTDADPDHPKDTGDDLFMRCDYYELVRIASGALTTQDARVRHVLAGQGRISAAHYCLTSRGREA